MAFSADVRVDTRMNSLYFTHYDRMDACIDSGLDDVVTTHVYDPGDRILDLIWRNAMEDIDRG